MWLCALLRSQTETNRTTMLVGKIIRKTRHLQRLTTITEKLHDDAIRAASNYTVWQAWFIALICWLRRDLRLSDKLSSVVINRQRRLTAARAALTNAAVHRWGGLHAQHNIVTSSQPSNFITSPQQPYISCTSRPTLKFQLC